MIWHADKVEMFVRLWQSLVFPKLFVEAICVLGVALCGVEVFSLATASRSFEKEYDYLIRRRSFAYPRHSSSHSKCLKKLHVYIGRIFTQEHIMSKINFVLQSCSSLSHQFSTKFRNRFWSLDEKEEKEKEGHAFYHQAC